MTEDNTPIEKREDGCRQFSLPVAIIFSALIIASAIFISRIIPTKDASSSSASKLSALAKVTDTDFVRGDKNAEVTIIEYADFSCGFCAEYHPILQKIVAESNGQVRWVYRHLPIFNIDAATASSCVGNLAGDEAFWKFADTMFANRTKYSADFYLKTAEMLGISETDFQNCVDGLALKTKIRSDFNQLKILYGLNGTPHTIIVDKDGHEFSFSGALPYDDLKGVIDSLI